MRFPTMWYVDPHNLRSACAYQARMSLYTSQNTTLLEFTCHGSLLYGSAHESWVLIANAQKPP